MMRFCPPNAYLYENTSVTMRIFSKNENCTTTDLRSGIALGSSIPLLSWNSPRRAACGQRRDRPLRAVYTMQASPHFELATIRHFFCRPYSRVIVQMHKHYHCRAVISSQKANFVFVHGGLDIRSDDYHRRTRSCLCSNGILEDGNRCHMRSSRSHCRADRRNKLLCRPRRQLWFGLSEEAPRIRLAKTV